MGRPIEIDHFDGGTLPYPWGSATTQATNQSSGLNYASSVTYSANNRINCLTFGNTLVEATAFNTRLQPSQIQVGTLLTLGFTYGTSNNNGNVQSQPELVTARLEIGN